MADDQNLTDKALDANAPAENDESVTLSNVDHDPNLPQAGPDENPAGGPDDPTNAHEPITDGAAVKRDGRKKDKRVSAEQRPALADHDDDSGPAIAEASDETDVVTVTDETQDPHLPSSPLAAPPLFEEGTELPLQVAASELDSIPTTPTHVDEVVAPKVGNRRVQTEEHDSDSPLPNSPAPENPAVAGLAVTREDAEEPQAGVRRITQDNLNSLEYGYFLSRAEAEEVLTSGVADGSAKERSLVKEIKGRRRPNHPLTLAENRREQRIAEENSRG
jgi:hypothetical protein